MTDDDPNEAYEVVPIAQTGRGPPEAGGPSRETAFL